jgi:hypothetical protein
MSHQDVIERLVAANPVPVTAVAGAASAADAQAALRQILAVPRQPSHRRLVRLRPARAVAIVAAGAVIAVSALMTVGPDSQLGAEPAAAQVLARASSVAAGQPDHPLRGGQYYFQQTRSTTLNTTVGGGRAYSTVVTSTRELWFALDGSGRLREVKQDVRLAGPGDHAEWRSSGAPPLSVGEHVVDELYRTGQLGAGRVAEADLDRLARLPRNADALLRAIVVEVAGKGRSEDVDGLTFQAIGELLANPAANSEIRAALFDAAARISDVSLLGRTVDGAGRSGVALGLDSSYSGSPSRYVLIFEPATSRLLETRVVLLDRVGYADIEPPAIVSSTVYLDAGYAASTKERPAR